MESYILYSNLLLWVVQLFVLFALFLLFRQFGEVYLKTGESISRDGIALGKKTLYPFLGRPVILVFISPDCKPCRVLLPEWNEMVERYHKQIQFIMIVQGEEDAKKKIQWEQTIKGEVLDDPKQKMMQDFQVRVTPFGFALDENSIVRAKGLCGGRKHLERMILILNKE